MNLVYDRTRADVEAAKKILLKYTDEYGVLDYLSITPAEHAQLERGTYTAVSMNRVESTVSALSSLLRAAGYNVPYTPSNPNYTATERTVDGGTPSAAGSTAIDGGVPGESGASVVDGGGAFPTLEVWKLNDVVSTAAWTQYIANVAAIRDGYYTRADTPELPSADAGIDYSGANAIERLLTDVETLIYWMKSSYRPCGTVKCGANAIHIPIGRG